MKNETKKQKGHSYRQAALELLARLGYATTRQLAKSLHNSTEISKRKMVGRTMRSLISMRFVVTKRIETGVNNANNEAIYALTEAGAAAARAIGSPLVAEKAHARDYLRHAHAHRTACNSVFCALNKAFSELEVRANEAPLSSVLVESWEAPEFRKIPDLIAIASSERLIWVEVENAYRSAADLDKMVLAMRSMYRQRESLNLGGVAFFVTDSSAKNIAERLREKLIHAETSAEKSSIKALDKTLYETFISVSLLDPETLSFQAIALSK